MKKNTIALIDYNMGNIQSIKNALDLFTDNIELVSEGDEIENPDAIVVPGVGSFAAGMKNLQERDFINPITELSYEGNTPFLGICLGMQFLAQSSTEQGKHDGLGWVSGNVQRIKPDNDHFRIPHMGWNKTNITKEQNPVLFQDFDGGESVYFVHSYHICPNTIDGELITATTSHGCEITAAIRSNNLFGVQFHPEKSQDVGLKLIKNFVDYIQAKD